MSTKAKADRTQFQISIEIEDLKVRTIGCRNLQKLYYILMMNQTFVDIW